MYEVVNSQERYRGQILTVVTDEVTMPDGSAAPRDVVVKLGAVGVVAIDDQDRVVMVRQYRHAVRGYLWELPAGLTDVDGEELVDAARRELAEEADVTAGRMEHLIDLYLSPGFTNETIRLFLARDLIEIPDGDRHERIAEEADMEIRRIPLAEAVEMILKGEIVNAASVAGILTTHTLLSGGASA